MIQGRRTAPYNFVQCMLEGTLTRPPSHSGLRGHSTDTLSQRTTTHHSHSGPYFHCTSALSRPPSHSGLRGHSTDTLSQRTTTATAAHTFTAPVLSPDRLATAVCAGTPPILSLNGPPRTTATAAHTFTTAPVLSPDRLATAVCAGTPPILWILSLNGPPQPQRPILSQLHQYSLQTA